MANAKVKQNVNDVAAKRKPSTVTKKESATPARAVKRRAKAAATKTVKRAVKQPTLHESGLNRATRNTLASGKKKVQARVKEAVKSQAKKRRIFS